MTLGLWITVAAMCLVCIVWRFDYLWQQRKRREELMRWLSGPEWDEFREGIRAFNAAVGAEVMPAMREAARRMNDFAQQL